MALGIGVVIAIAMITIRLVFAHGFNEFKTELTIRSDNSERSYNQFYDELSKVYQRTGGATWEEFASLYNVSDAIEQVDTAHQLFYLKKETSYNLYNTDYILCCYEAASIKVKNEKVLDEFSEFKNALNEDYSSVRHLLNNSTVDKALSWTTIGDCQMFFPFVEVATIRDDVSNDLRKILGDMSTRIQSIESYNDAVRKEYDKQLRSAISNVGYSIRSSVESSMGGGSGVFV